MFVSFQEGNWYLEDHPRTCKWLVTMIIVIKSPISGVVGPLPNGVSMVYKWLISPYLPI